MKISNMKKQQKWEPLLYRPELPEGWSCQEQLTKPGESYITFVKWGKIHHNDEPRKIYIVFNEFETEEGKSRFLVRGGRNVKPEEKLKNFKDVKSATSYIWYLAENTNRWLNEINDPKYIASYNNSIQKQVKAQEEYERRMKEAFESID
jgi:hypothetical protein